MQVLAQRESNKAFCKGGGGRKDRGGHDCGLFVAQVKTVLARMIGTFE